MMEAWYFSRTDKKLRYGDGRIIQAGKMHTINDTPVLCNCGLHGSKRIIDALLYAPGPYIWRVDITRKINEGAGKLCGQRRKYLWGFDASDVLFEFSRKQALINIEKIKPYTDKYDLIVTYLNTGDQRIKAAAEVAAMVAARAAAEIAAVAAAEAAAEVAAMVAARAAAEIAAVAAAEVAARSAARSAAWSAAMAAAVAAAEVAARSAARSAADTDLECLIFNEARKLNLLKEK